MENQWGILGQDREVGLIPVALFSFFLVPFFFIKKLRKNIS